MPGAWAKRLASVPVLTSKEKKKIEKEDKEKCIYKKIGKILMKKKTYV